MGEGRPLVIVHGGPGFDHSYLVEWLEPLAERRTLVFYDQLGVGPDVGGVPRVTADELVAQLETVAEGVRNEGPYGILAHSWGTHLALDMLMRQNVAGPEELILVNPFPLTFERFCEVGARRMARVPPAVIAEIEKLAASEDPDERVRSLELALPYYMSTPDAASRIHFASYSDAVFQAVLGSVQGFDLRPAGGMLPARSLLIYSELDFIRPEDSEELQVPGAVVAMLAGCGHFPFVEDQPAFMKVVGDFLS